MSDPINKAFDSFINQAETLRKKENEITRVNNIITKEKDAILQPIRDLLKRFVDLGIWVHDRNKFERTLLKSDSDKLPAQLFSVYEDPSSPRWLPGCSLYIEHPAEIEIAVPNETERDKFGLIVITCSDNPHQAILSNKIFRDVESACMAISEFLVRNHVKLDRYNLDDDSVTLKK